MILDVFARKDDPIGPVYFSKMNTAISMSKWMQMLIILVIGLVALPVSFFITIFLSPLWSLVESVTGIESIGHSGPSDWCFIAVYIIFLALGILVLYLRIIKSKDITDEEEL